MMMWRISQNKMRWVLLCGLLAIFGVGLNGCMLKSTHVKKVNELQDQINGLNKDKSEIQDKFDSAERHIKKLQKDKRRLTKSQQRLEKKLAELAQDRNNCQNNLRELTATRGELGAKLQSAITQIERLQQLARERKALFDRLRASLQSMVDAGKLSVRMRHGLMVLQLSENILFDSGQSQVKRDGRLAIEQVTQLLKNTKRRWQVSGHTDDRGDVNFNWRLSVQRALSVQTVMLKAGMPPDMISVAGFGQYQPVVDNDSAENRALNRRTEIVLLPNLEELQLASLPSPFWVCRNPVASLR